jgi:hypothetical protein
VHILFACAHTAAIDNSWAIVDSDEQPYNAAIVIFTIVTSIIVTIGRGRGGRAELRRRVDVARGRARVRRAPARLPRGVVRRRPGAVVLRDQRPGVRGLALLRRDEACFADQRTVHLKQQWKLHALAQLSK